MTKKLNDIYRQEIAKSIFKLVNAGYGVNLSKNSITVTELFKSKVRDRYITERVRERQGGTFFQDIDLRLTMDNFREYVRELIDFDK